MPLFGPPNVDKLEEKRDLRSLIKALAHKDTFTRMQAAEALGRLGDARAVGPLVAALRDPNEHVQENASRALARTGEPAVGPLVEVVTGDLDSMDHSKKLYVRGSAAEALARIASPAAVDRLIAAFSSADDDVRWYAAAALSGSRETRVIDALIGLLGDKSPHVCAAAAKSLGKIGDRRAVGPLIGLLQRGIEDDAAEALGVIGDPRAVQPLIDALETLAGNDHRWRLPCAIIDALSRLIDTRATEPLAAFLSHKSSYQDGSELTRMHLAIVLGDIGDETVVAVLERTLTTDPDETVRRVAAMVLGKMAERGKLGPWVGIAHTALKVASEADTPDVRKDALEALAKFPEAS